ncbi:energy transducer TonB [Sulfurimonas sp.]|jgi:protein TonB|uniref:energy transducer TonB n=1 Tax=Sulfurimonas sp. TaxID=2022749 RepID=UPI0025F918AA|nr:energy transducer TonB [Sulfurimonas sp.]MCK9473768.1 TonB family protein [Sulfurimonas sp.]
MHRYLSSFILSSIAYILVGVLIIYFISIDTYSDKTTKIINIQKVCLSTVIPKIEPKVEQEPKPIEPKPKPIEPKPKPKPKPIKPKPEPKPIEPQPEPEPVEPEPEPEPTVEHTESKVEEKVTPQPEQTKKQENISNVVAAANADMMKAKRELFIANLIKRINSNKSYPRSARRRAIEGNIEVEFTITADGGVKNIQVISGHDIFKKSAIEAIKNSFPIDIEKGVFNFPKKFKIDIVYILK